MSSYTTNLQLFKYNTATDGKQVFSIDDAMNDNWDKIDAFAKAIKDLSNLSSVGEKRFTDINNELSQKLEAQVSLAQNGYIKFNNKVVIAWLYYYTGQTYAAITINFPITFTKVYSAVGTGLQTENFFTATSPSVSPRTESLGRIVMSSITNSAMKIQRQNPSYYIVIGTAN